MATTKSAGTVKTGRDSKPKYLGVKVYGGQKVKIGDVIIRQRGSRFLPGKNTKKGRDDTIYATAKGTVLYKTTRKSCFDNRQRVAKVVNVTEEN